MDYRKEIQDPKQCIYADTIFFCLILAVKFMFSLLLWWFNLIHKLARYLCSRLNRVKLAFMLIRHIQHYCVIFFLKPILRIYLQTFFSSDFTISWNILKISSILSILKSLPNIINKISKFIVNITIFSLLNSHTFPGKYFFNFIVFNWQIWYLLGLHFVYKVLLALRACLLSN